MEATTDTTEVPTFVLPSYLVEHAQAKLDKFNRLAAKHDLAQAAIVELDRTESTVTTESGFDRKITMVTLRLDGADLLLPGGYQLAATLDHDAAGNIYRTNPHFTAASIPDEFRTTSAGRCDHCGAVRRRNQTILVWSATEGFKQVGSDCVRLYLGISVTSILNLLDTVGAVEDEESYGPSGGFHYDPLTVREFVAAASIVTMLYGFQSTQYEGASTKGITLEWLDCFRRPNTRAADHFFKQYPALKNVTDDEKAKATTLAEAATAWIATDSSTSDYITNLRLAAARERVGKNAGLLASLPNAYKRTLADRVEKAAKATLPASTFLGSVGDKLTGLDASLVYTNISAGYARYSPDSLFAILVTTTGAKLYINTTVETAIGRTLDNAEQGATFTLAGTVKSHKTTNKGEQVTVLTRAAII